MDFLKYIKPIRVFLLLNDIKVILNRAAYKNRLKVQYVQAKYFFYIYLQFQETVKKIYIYSI